MAALSQAGSVVTFYSWKGGVGRTMVLANVAVQLARMGSTVLAVDWDLEAPGLDRFFMMLNQTDVANPEAPSATDPTGLMGLLFEASEHGDAKSDKQDWQDRLVHIQVPPAQPTPSIQTPLTPSPIHLLPSGYGVEGYAKRLSEFSWSGFFADSRGGEWLEALRDQWSASYDFVLIDSRTGLTDSGGVCTIQMPHMLVLVFTANDQSVEGGLRVVAAAQQARRDFGYDRGPLVVIPVLTRWEGEKEVDIGDQWMKRLDRDLVPITALWLPKDFSPRQFLEKTRVPHVPRFTFGEPLPVVTHSLSDPGLPGLYFDTIARLILSQLSNVGTIIDPTYPDRQPNETIEERLTEIDIPSAGGVEIFVSYRTLDDVPPPGVPHQRGFVSYLVRQLRWELAQMGLPFAVLWKDRARIEAGDTWSDAVVRAIDDSQLFIVVVSKNYVTSHWCEAELSTIASRVAKLDAQAGQRRIFRVDKHSVPKDEIPKTLRRIQPVQFYSENDEDDGVDEFYWRGKVRRTKEYEDAVNKLARAICKRLKELGIRVERPVETRPRSSGALPDNGRVVFVAKPASDMLETYRAFVWELWGRGYRVTPDGDKELSDLGEHARSTVMRALENAEVSIHLLGQRKGGRPEGLDMDLVPMQLAAAADEARKRPGFIRMIWAPKVLMSQTGAVVERDPLSVVEGFGARLETDKIDGDTASRFTEYALQVLERVGRQRQ
jgi:TIR domain/CobQ/CobB/MinD/ParA nucleotide binding domain